MQVYASLAQMVERTAFNRVVMGSIPMGGVGQLAQHGRALVLCTKGQGFKSLTDHFSNVGQMVDRRDF